MAIRSRRLQFAHEMANEREEVGNCDRRSLSHSDLRLDERSSEHRRGHRRCIIRQFHPMSFRASGCTGTIAEGGGAASSSARAVPGGAAA